MPLLQQSVHGFRTLGRTGEIDYAYALYNLGTALRAVGDPGDAIPLLEERLQVSNYKRGVVQQELALARAQAGQGALGGAAGAGRRHGARQRPARQQRPRQGRRRRGLSAPPAGAIPRAGHRDIPRSEDADLDRNSARSTVQGPRARGR